MTKDTYTTAQVTAVLNTMGIAIPNGYELSGRVVDLSRYEDYTGNELLFRDGKFYSFRYMSGDQCGFLFEIVKKQPKYRYICDNTNPVFAMLGDWVVENGRMSEVTHPCQFTQHVVFRREEVVD